MHKAEPLNVNFANILKFDIFDNVKRLAPGIFTKSGLMVGLGEGKEEIVQVMDDLRVADVDFLTIGQYLQPTDRHLPVDRFPEPERYAEWDNEAREMGYRGVACGPLVRSSFRAGLLRDEAYGGAPAVTRSSTNSAISFLKPNSTIPNTLRDSPIQPNEYP